MTIPWTYPPPSCHHKESKPKPSFATIGYCVWGGLDTFSLPKGEKMVWKPPPNINWFPIESQPLPKDTVDGSEIRQSPPFGCIKPSYMMGFQLQFHQLVIAGFQPSTVSPTWRIIPFSKWLITMVSKSPK